MCFVYYLKIIWASYKTATFDKYITSLESVISFTGYNVQMVHCVIKNTETTVEKNLLKNDKFKIKSSSMFNSCSFFFFSMEKTRDLHHGTERQTFTEERLFDAQNKQKTGHHWTWVTNRPQMWLDILNDLQQKVF